MLEKICSRCGKSKSIDCFYENKKSGGTSVYCKPCQSKYNNERKDKKKAAEYNKKWVAKRKKTDVGYEKRRYADKMEKLSNNPAKLEAERFIANLHGKDRKKNHDLTIDKIESMFNETTNCQCCGKELRILPPSEKGAKCHDAASIDRVDNDLDYCSDNIAVICLECNTKKGNLTVADINMILDYMGRFSNV